MMPAAITRPLHIAGILAASLGTARAQHALSTNEPLRHVQTMALPGITGRLDHMAVDVERQRLYVAALGHNTVEVLDLRTGGRIRSLGGCREPQGVACLLHSDRVCVTNGDGGECLFFTADSLPVVGSLPLTDDADNVRYDAGRARLYVGYGSGGLAIIRESDAKLLGTVPLSGHPEAFQAESSGARAYVNIPSGNQIAVVQLDSGRVVERWRLGSTHSNFPMALDEAAHRLYVGCRTPPTLLVYNTQTGQIVSHSEIEGDVDDVFLDRQKQRLYISCGSGFVQVLQRDGDDRLETVAKITTRRGARTCLFVPELGRLYVAAPRQGDQDAVIEVFEVLP